MSDAEQFTAAVPERSGPRDWRGGLERSGARRGSDCLQCQPVQLVLAMITAPPLAQAAEKREGRSRAIAASSGFHGT